MLKFTLEHRKTAKSNHRKSYKNLSHTAKCGIIFMRFVLPYIKNSTLIYERGKSGGAEENRTPVRKPIRQPFYTLSEVF